MKKHLLIFLLIIVVALSFNYKVKAWGIAEEPYYDIKFYRNDSTYATINDVNTSIGYYLNNYIKPSSWSDSGFQRILDFVNNKKYEELGYKYYFVVLSNYTLYVLLSNNTNFINLTPGRFSSDSPNIFLSPVFDLSSDYACYRSTSETGHTLEDCTSGFVSEFLFNENNYYFGGNYGGFSDGVRDLFTLNYVQNDNNRIFSNFPGIKYISLSQNYDVDVFSTSHHFVKSNSIGFNGTDVIYNNGDYVIKPYSNVDGIPIYDLNIDDYQISNIPSFPPSGYKEVVIPTSALMVNISGVNSGNIYVSVDNKFNYESWVSYREVINGNVSDKNFSIQYYNYFPYDVSTEKPTYLYWSFDLSKVENSEFVSFFKVGQAYQGSSEDVTYSIWVPNDAYVSFTSPIENDVGGNDFDYEWKDPVTGDINTDTDSTTGGSSNLISDFFNNLLKGFNQLANNLTYLFQCFSAFYLELPVTFKVLYVLAINLSILFIIFKYLG